MIVRGAQEFRVKIGLVHQQGLVSYGQCLNTGARQLYLEGRRLLFLLKGKSFQCLSQTFESSQPACCPEFHQSPP
jgi:hypothetical protein